MSALGQKRTLSSGTINGTGLRLLDSDVEVEHFVTDPDILIESYGRTVLVVRLDVNNPGTTSCGNLAQMDYKGGCDALLRWFSATARS